MSGPIVRTGTNPKFWKNWDNVFGDKSGKGKAGQDGEVNAFAKPRKKAAKAAAKKAEPKNAQPAASTKKKAAKKKKGSGKK